MRVGLTGGVGSGKSTTAALLAAHGAVVIDADRIAREVVEPGTDGFRAVVDAFGPDVVGADGALDRAALAARVFAGDAELARLNAIVHPLVGRRSAELMAAAPPEAVLAYDVPLLVESGRRDEFDLVVVVLADPDVRIARLAGRGMAEPDARARMAKQASDEQRRALADVVLTNDGDRAALAAQVDALWARIAGEAGGLEAPGGIG